MSYIHGYSRDEQDRLDRQARWWQHLIVERIAPDPGARILEIGCGCGSVLGVLARSHPDAALTGIDIAETQIIAARESLSEVSNVDLYVGDAAALPFEDDQFDFVYGMWVLEHISDVQAALREVRRSLRPGGSVSFIEADYWSLCPHPESPDVCLVFECYARFFESRGHSRMGRLLGSHLGNAGFRNVECTFAGFHFFAPTHADELAAMTAYVREFIEPSLDDMAHSCNVPLERLRRGLDELLRLHEHPFGSLTGTIFNGVGTV